MTRRDDIVTAAEALVKTFERDYNDELIFDFDKLYALADAVNIDKQACEHGPYGWPFCQYCTGPRKEGD